MDMSAATVSPSGSNPAYDFSGPSSNSTPIDHYDPFQQHHQQQQQQLQQQQQQASQSPAGLPAPPTSGMPMTFTPTGPMTLDPSLPPSDALNPRSCVVCRKRKVRCDKHMPCSNCRKANIQCIFPAPGRAPRRPRPKDPNAPPKQAIEREVELMKRLRKLEGIVEDLSGQVEFETYKPPSSTDNSPGATTENHHDKDRRLSHGHDQAHRRTPHSDPGDIGKGGRSSLDSGISSPTVHSLRRDFGRLVLNEKGKTKYISNPFWAKVTDEINELKAEAHQLNEMESEASDDEDSPEMHSYGETGDHHGFLLGYRSSDVDLSKLHPPLTQIPYMWQVYIDNVDPLVKVLHIPTMSATIRSLRKNMSAVTPGMEALLFSIYYAAVTSMEPEEVLSSLGAEKSYLVNQYRFACEQALARAEFLTTSEIVVAQAFTLFLVLVRRHDETRFAWTLTSVLVRIGHSMGLHREGTNLAGLNPFDVEMRRRLWWAMCVIDLRGAEDHGTELIIGDGSFDTRMPLNINDVDIEPDSPDFPPEREGPTDMTFTLVRVEICSYARRAYMSSSSMNGCHHNGWGTVAERENLLDAVHHKVEVKYLRDPIDEEKAPLHWVVATIHRLVMAKIRLMLYQPLLITSEVEEVVSQEMHDRVYLSAVEVVEYTRIINTEPKARQWRWLFQTYTQWHAVAFVLIEVIRRPWSASVERGWMALSATFTDPEPTESTMVALHAAVWLPMRKLMIKARRHREKELARLRADPEAARLLDLEESNQSLTPTFRHLASSSKNAEARERWRKLVGREGFDPRTESPRSSNVPTQSIAQIPGGPGPMQAQYLSQVMTDPSFNTASLFDAAFPGESAFDQMRQATFYGGIFGPGAYDQNIGRSPESQQQQATPQQAAQSPIQQGTPSFNGNAPTAPGTFQPTSSKAYGGAINAASVSGAGTTPNPAMANAQTSAEPLVSNTAPSWLWSNQWAAGQADGSGNGNPRVDGVDLDMNMDEDFSWQNWQDTLRGFDPESSLGIGRPGFLGGI